MKIIKSDQNKAISKAVQILKEGGLIIYPTETCYGVGVDATNQKAVNKLLQYKTRRIGKPISMAVSDKKMAKKYVKINKLAENLYDNYLPGPITVVSVSKEKVATGIEDERKTIGIRVPDHKLILNLIRQLEKPITSTSANMSYGPVPYDIKSLLNNLPKKQKKLIDLIIDAGKLEKNDPSTVVDTTLNNLNIMRQGTIQLKEKTQEKNLILQAHTDKPEDTTKFGSLNMLKFIDTPLDKCLIFLLSGELGSGKTQFTKGVAQKLKINKIVKSPTFTLINEYLYKLDEHRKGILVHIDTWRIQSFRELQKLGIKRFIKPGNIIVIEWADKFYKKFLKEFNQPTTKIITVKFKYINQKERKLRSYK